MALGFHVRYLSTDQTTQGERTLHQLPIRFGRNPLNHCAIALGFISDFHAIVEYIDGRISVRDLGSKNGTYSASGERIAPNVPLFLTPPDHPFFLSKFIHVHVRMDNRPSAGGERAPSMMRGTVLGNRSAIEAPSVPPTPAEGHRSPYPGAPPARGLAGPPGTQNLTSMPIESLAFIGLKELASSLVPGVPLSTPGEIARLLTKLHDTVEVFCRCFAPLRAGYEQFASSMDLVRAASQRSLNRSPTGTRVEMARDPASLASALLDWRSRDFDGPEVLEAIVADLIAHQTAILGSVMTGVHALLDEIGPAKIQENVQSGRHTLLLGRYRALWEAFKAAHDALSDQTRVFDLVFGPDFASEYRKQLSQQRDPPSRSP